MIDESNLKIAVVGAGISGIMSAYLLGRRHRVTLFEKNDYIPKFRRNSGDIILNYGSLFLFLVPAFDVSMFVLIKPPVSQQTLHRQGAFPSSRVF